MKLILHIGMGKTGTSSIQRALKNNAQSLREQNVAYLGMWFDCISPELTGIKGIRHFFDEARAPESPARQKFLEMLEREKAAGMATCILSNEAFLGQHKNAIPFLQWLKTQVDLSIIAYVREPYSWFPSAFTQWGIRHKTLKGPIQPFADRVKLIAQYHYQPLLEWQNNFDDCFKMFEHKKSIDIVENFAEVTGIAITPMKERVLERGEKAEILLRALFNDRFESAVLPARFHEAILPQKRDAIVDVDEMIARCFDHSAIDDIVEENSEVLNLIRSRHGLELKRGKTNHGLSTKEVEAIRRRLFDYMVEITIRQGLAIEKLTERLEKLEADGEKK